MSQDLRGIIRILETQIEAVKTDRDTMKELRKLSNGNDMDSNNKKEFLKMIRDLQREKYADAFTTNQWLAAVEQAIKDAKTKYDETIAKHRDPKFFSIKDASRYRAIEQKLFGEVQTAKQNLAELIKRYEPTISILRKINENWSEIVAKIEGILRGGSITAANNSTKSLLLSRKDFVDYYGAMLEQLLQILQKERRLTKTLLSDFSD